MVIPLGSLRTIKHLCSSNRIALYPPPSSRASFPVPTQPQQCQKSNASLSTFRKPWRNIVGWFFIWCTKKSKNIFVAHEKISVPCKINMHRILPAVHYIQRKVHANHFSCGYKGLNQSVEGQGHCLKLFSSVPASGYPDYDQSRLDKMNCVNELYWGIDSSL